MIPAKLIRCLAFRSAAILKETAGWTEGRERKGMLGCLAPGGRAPRERKIITAIFKRLRNDRNL